DERPSKTASGSQSGDTGKADGNSGSATDTNSGDKQ
ncbi:septum formation initiator family protein, partial [Bifidobacterium bifidum]